MARETGDPRLTAIYGRWHKEIFADLAALLLAGPAAAWGMAEFLAHPAPRALTYRHGGVPSDRLPARADAGRDVAPNGLHADAATAQSRVAHALRPGPFPPAAANCFSASADRLIPRVVDEIAWQTRRNLAHHALADIISFREEDEAAIRAGARRLLEGRHAGSVAAAAPPGQRGELRASRRRAASARAGEAGRDPTDAEHPPAPPTISAAQAALAA